MIQLRECIFVKAARMPDGKSQNVITARDGDAGIAMWFDPATQLVTFVQKVRGALKTSNTPAGNVTNLDFASEEEKLFLARVEKLEAMRAKDVAGAKKPGAAA